MTAHLFLMRPRQIKTIQKQCGCYNELSHMLTLHTECRRMIFWQWQNDLNFLP